jgi:2-methylcitrate dehydratase PrpD
MQFNVSEPGRALGRAIAELGYEQIPPDVFGLAKRFSLDTLGVLAAGTKAPGIRELAEAMGRLESASGTATVLVGGGYASPPAAALINAASAHALDFDDTHDVARVHAFSVVLPAAIAAAQAETRVSGRDFLTAIVVGAELFCRLGLACPNNLAKGWHPTTGFGCFAAAATVGKILHLDSEQMMQALALAYVQMSGNTQSITDGALSKRLGPGFAARNGLTAAYLARSGLTGPWRFLEGKAGLFAQYEDRGGAPDQLLEEFGAQWRLTELSMKPYPCCRCTHTLIHIGIDLHKEGIDPSQIDNGTLYLGATNHKIVGAPFDPGHNNPVVHAQFNACYTFARAIEDGRIDIASFAPDQVRAHTSTAAKLSCEISPEIDAEALAPARLRLVFRDGTERVIVRPTMIGSPEAPMTDAEVTEKFTTNLKWGWDLDAAAAGDLADLVSNLEKAGDIRPLLERLRLAATVSPKASAA